MSKILVLKNDRASYLMTPLKLISSFNIKDNKLKIYLSEINIYFSFINKNIPNDINKINGNR